MARPNQLQKTVEDRYQESQDPGDLFRLQIYLWRGVERATEMIEAEDFEMARKALHSLAQVTGSYLKVYEVGELSERIKQLENKLNAAV